MGNNHRGKSRWREARRRVLFKGVILAAFSIATTPVKAALNDPIDSAAQEQLRQLERERVLRGQQEPRPDERQLELAATPAVLDYPAQESPCFTISQIQLVGDAAHQFQFALADVTSGKHQAIGRCLGAQGLNVAMAHMQNAVIAKGFVTTRILAAPQDLSSGQLVLTVIPGRVRQVRLTEDSSTRARLWNAVPIRPGDILNLRDIEMGLENLKRIPTAEADIQIVPADGASSGGKPEAAQAETPAKPGESDIVIRYRQRFPFRVTLSADDAGFDTTGKYQGGITVSGDNLLTLNDLFYLNYNHDLGGGDAGKRGSKGHTAHYSLPYGYWLFGVTGSDYTYHQRVAGINQSYVYSGQTQNMEMRASRMVYRNAINKTIVSVGSFFKKSFNYIDDTEIEVQRRRTAGWTIGFNQSWYLGQTLLDYNLNYRRGTGAKQSLAAPEEPFGEGTSRLEALTADLSLNVPFSLQMPWGNQALRYSTNARAQYNYTPMTPQERFAIGNRYTVRGFDGERVISADRGWFIRNDLSALLGNSGQAVYIGLDYGEVGGQSSDILPGKQLAGAVVGLRGAYKGFSYDVFAGRPLKKPQRLETADNTAGFNVNWSF